MSLYYDAATIITKAEAHTGSLKSLVYGTKDLKSPSAQIYALVSESAKWSTILKEILETTEVLRHERKLTPALALVLAHDLLLTKRGVIAPSTHVLKIAISNHKTRLTAELTKLRIKRGFASIEACRQHINGTLSSDGTTQHPRWVRVNTLLTTLERQLQTTFEGYQQEKDIGKVINADATAKILKIDEHIPNLLALPPKIELVKSEAYLSGQIILQDKASCFPAYLLDVSQCDGQVIDACAAPGNKTTHVASLLHECSSGHSDRRVLAFEKDKRRAEILRKMVKLAGTDKVVHVKGPKDFLETKPNSEEMQDVGALLLDPSCSGSGIVGRDEATFTVELPTPSNAQTTAPRVKKRKRKPEQPDTTSSLKPRITTTRDQDATEEENPVDASDAESLKQRLTNLSSFQLHILKHAMRFPSARRITYSTCSVHFAENESVVFRALMSDVARERGWRILKREEQVEGLRKWHGRGRMSDDEARDIVVPEEMGKGGVREDVLEGCIRCEKGTADGTMGFFVAGFVREMESAGEHMSRLDAGERDTRDRDGGDVTEQQDGGDEDAEEDEDEDEEEWNGFSDDE